MKCCACNGEGVISTPIPNVYGGHGWKIQKCDKCHLLGAVEPYSIDEFILSGKSKEYKDIVKEPD